MAISKDVRENQKKVTKFVTDFNLAGGSEEGAALLMITAGTMLGLSRKFTKQEIEFFEFTMWKIFADEFKQARYVRDEIIKRRIN
jgi:6-phosphogluconolactonase/glucosamine-6-phosphate isomerase/deaminase